jgi:RNA polymerase sigma-70 factor (ECF subfamily)
MNEASFQSFYAGTAGPLRAYVARTLGDFGQVDDIVQETFLRLLRTAAVPDDPLQMRKIAFRIASNLMADEWRRRQRMTLQAETAPEPGAAGPDPVLRVDMARVFAELKPQQRQMLWLSYVEGADHREIATAIGVREGSVRVLLHRARKKLASLLT